MKSVRKPVIYSTVSQYAKLENDSLHILRATGWIDWEAKSKSKEKYPGLTIGGVKYPLSRLKHCLDIKADVSGSDDVHHRDNDQYNNACANLTTTDHRTNIALDMITILPKKTKAGGYKFDRRMRKPVTIRGVNGKSVSIFGYTCGTPEEYWRVLAVYNKYFGVCGKYYQNLLAAVNSDNVDRAEIRAFMFSKM